jgi:TatD DNase family protein
VIDTHCHLTSAPLAPDAPAVIARARAAGVHGLITVATSAADAEAALALAADHEGVWCTAGMHPLYADEPRDWPAIRRVAERPECVAWGELGLDNHYEKPPRELQDAVLEEHLALVEAAASEGLVRPVVVHCREAFDELLAVFRATALDPTRFVFHCFTGGPDEARAVLDFGAWISFTGVVTFRNAREVAEAAKLVPADRIMVETDAPYLAPEPVRKTWPNEPCHVVHTARFLADLRGVEPEAWERALDANAERFFGIEIPAR